MCLREQVDRSNLTLLKPLLILIKFQSIFVASSLLFTMEILCNFKIFQIFVLFFVGHQVVLVISVY